MRVFLQARAHDTYGSTWLSASTNETIYHGVATAVARVCKYI